MFPISNGMKKFYAIIFLIIIGIVGFLYLKKQNVTPAVSDTKTYRNSNLGISFDYPKTLTPSSIGQNVVLHHEVPFTHHDFCDFRGESTSTIDTLTDFNVTFNVVNKNVIGAMKDKSPYIPEENFVNGEIVPSPGFIDAYQNGNLSGYKIFEGAEGCGHTIYYLKVTDQKTLVVIDDLITVFTGAITADIENAAKAVPDVLDREKAEAVFEEVLSTVSVQ